MAIFTTGAIRNAGSSPSTSIDVVISNDDLAVDATIELEVFEVTVSAAGSAKVGVAHQLFTVPPLTVATRTVSIAGFAGYEVHLDVTGTTRRYRRRVCFGRSWQSERRTASIAGRDDDHHRAYAIGVGPFIILANEVFRQDT